MTHSTASWQSGQRAADAADTHRQVVKIRGSSMRPCEDPSGRLRDGRRIALEYATRPAARDEEPTATSTRCDFSVVTDYSSGLAASSLRTGGPVPSSLRWSFSTHQSRSTPSRTSANERSTATSWRVQFGFEPAHRGCSMSADPARRGVPGWRLGWARAVPASVGIAPPELVEDVRSEAEHRPRRVRERLTPRHRRPDPVGSD